MKEFDDKSRDIEFLKVLHEEKIATQKLYSQYTLVKLSFLTIILGIGAGNFSQIFVLPSMTNSNSFLLYVVPVIVICFDLFIFSADLSVFRMGAWFKSPEFEGNLCNKWENFIQNKRTSFRIGANSIVSLLLIGTAGTLTFLNNAGNEANQVITLVWFSILFCFFVYIRLDYKKRKNCLTKNEGCDENGKGDK